MILNYKKLKKSLLGLSIPQPVSGTLSGHAAGEPFDKLVYEHIKTMFPSNTYRQFEYLNDLYSKNPSVIAHEDRQNLFNSPTALFLLSRGKDATNKWSLENPFEEKQNDTADILLVKDYHYEIVDIKTRNLSKKAQPPNIISSYKLAQLCAKMIDNKEFDTFSINHIELDWELETKTMVCKDVHFANLFKCEPSTLYINWAAALQLQFHVCDVDQSFKGTTKAWAKQYIRHFVASAKQNSLKIIEKFVKPFEKYL